MYRHPTHTLRHAIHTSLGGVRVGPPSRGGGIRRLPVSRSGHLLLHRRLSAWVRVLRRGVLLVRIRLRGISQSLLSLLLCLLAIVRIPSRLVLVLAVRAGTDACRAWLSVLPGR
jgi:hypothetical protein